MRNINTKKITALLLACLLAASSLTACGSDASSGNAGADGSQNGGAQDEKADSSKTGQSSEKAQDDGGAQDADTDASSEEQQTAGGDGYLSYDDLPNEQSFILWLDEGNIRFKCNYPDSFAFEGSANGMGSENSVAFSLVMAHSEQLMPDTSLEDALYALLKGDEFHHTLRRVNRATYDDMTPDETESVTLDCGREALRFSGLQHMDDYGTTADCPIYGYCTMLNDIPVIICYIIFDEEKYEEDRLAESEHYYSPDELDHYIQEMLNTLRIAEE